MSSSRFIALALMLGGFSLLGCAVDQADDGVGDNDADGFSAAVSRSHKPVCKRVGRRNEGWYWQDTGRLIKKEKCADIELACAAIGSRSESYVRADNGQFIAWGFCGSMLRVAADGKNCGGSIGYSCEYGHSCYGMPAPGVIGGTGICHDTELGYCENQADCDRTMPVLAPPATHECKDNRCVRTIATANLGDICGGFANVQCSAGLECVGADGQPAPTGTCVPAGEAEGEKCGGRAGLACAEGLFCAFPVNTCMTIMDGSGTCTRKVTGYRCPPPNPNIDNRVCDCNGNTQADRCHAKVANVSIAHAGPCE